MVTSENLVLAVMDRLEESGSDGSFEPETADKIRNALPRLFKFLLDTNVVLQPVGPDEIDEGQFFALRSFVAWKLAGDFGMAGNAPLAAEGAQAVEDLKTLARINRGTRRTLSVDSALTGRRSSFRISG
jgi:hypothetical protein